MDSLFDTSKYDRPTGDETFLSQRQSLGISPDLADPKKRNKKRRPRKPRGIRVHSQPGPGGEMSPNTGGEVGDRRIVSPDNCQVDDLIACRLEGNHWAARIKAKWPALALLEPLPLFPFAPQEITWDDCEKWGVYFVDPPGEDSVSEPDGGELLDDENLIKSSSTSDTQRQEEPGGTVPEPTSTYKDQQEPTLIEKDRDRVKFSALYPNGAIADFDNTSPGDRLIYKTEVRRQTERLDREINWIAKVEKVNTRSVYLSSDIDSPHPAPQRLTWTDCQLLRVQVVPSPPPSSLPSGEDEPKGCDRETRIRLSSISCVFCLPRYVGRVSLSSEGIHIAVRRAGEANEHSLNVKGNDLVAALDAFSQFVNEQLALDGAATSSVSIPSRSLGYNAEQKEKDCTLTRDHTERDEAEETPPSPDKHYDINLVRGRGYLYERWWEWSNEKKRHRKKYVGALGEMSPSEARQFLREIKKGESPE